MEIDLKYIYSRRVIEFIVQWLTKKERKIERKRNKVKIFERMKSSG